jgi:hypothetical protein
LHDQCLHAIGMRQRHAEANRAAVILHVEGVARNSQCLSEVIHDLGDVIESVGELFRIRPIAVAEARIIGRDQMIVIREPRQQRLKHSR